MPKTAKKKPPVVSPPKQQAQPQASLPGATQAASDGREVVYNKLNVVEYSTTSKIGPLTIEDMKGLLGWQTEKEFQAQEVAKDPSSKPEHHLFGDDYHCVNASGEKVRCNHNANNRPFDLDWSKNLMSCVLNGQWAGPFTIPGATVNGETIRISRYGDVISGQHQMTGCILADEWLHLKRTQLGREEADRRYPAWAGQDHCFLETIVVTGLSDDQRVLMTIDYVKPRTAADVFYTSEVFRESTPAERRELCRMLSGAVETLWTRTDARGYRTHPELMGFMERHKRLLKCVESIFSENSAKAGRKLSKDPIRLQPGVCAALMFIQGSSGPKTDGDVYRNEEPPTEKNLDWSLWDKAEEFWTLLAQGRDFDIVRTALGRLVDSTPQDEKNQGLGGRGPEKLAILSKAWERWRDHSGAGAPFDASDLAPGGGLDLSYVDVDDRGNPLPNGQVKLVDVADFYGIDCPESTIGKKPPRGSTPDAPAPTQEEISKLAEEARQRRAQQGSK